MDSLREELARVFERGPRLILANQPTRGLDMGAAAEVGRRLLEARERGAGVFRRFHQMRAVAQKPVGAAGARVQRGAGQGHDLAPLFAGEAGRDQGSRLQRSFHHQRRYVEYLPGLVA